MSNTKNFKTSDQIKLIKKISVASNIKDRSI